jgi:hypothetical protein
MINTARRYHRDGIRRHFPGHLTEADLTKLASTLEKARTHVRRARKFAAVFNCGGLTWIDPTRTPDGLFPATAALLERLA